MEILAKEDEIHRIDTADEAKIIDGFTAPSDQADFKVQDELTHFISQAGKAKRTVKP